MPITSQLLDFGSLLTFRVGHKDIVVSKLTRAVNVLTLTLQKPLCDYCDEEGRADEAIRYCVDCEVKMCDADLAVSVFVFLVFTDDLYVYSRLSPAWLKGQRAKVRLLPKVSCPLYHSYDPPLPRVVKY